MAFAMSKRSVLGLVAGAIMSLGLVAPSLAAEGGTVAVTGTNSAKLIVTISTPSIGFGTVDPSGLDSAGTTDFVVATGAAYVSNTDVTVTINSNKSWTGTIAASASSGTSDITIGSLRYTHATGAVGTPATTYAGATGSPSIAFNTAATSWDGGASTSSASYTDNYALRVDWTNTPGTFITTVTYAVSQS